MASTVPAKSQSLHNFTLPELWNKGGHSGGHLQRRRSIKSPSRRPTTSSASPVRQSPLRDSVSSTPPRHQSPLPNLAAAVARESSVRGDHLGKQSPTTGESYPVREFGRHSSVGGDSVRHSPRPDLSSESEALRKGKGPLLEYRKIHTKNTTSDGIRNGVYSTNPERATQKFETKLRAKEVDPAGVKKSKFLIKIPCKSTKTEEAKHQEEPLKIVKNTEHDEDDQIREEGKINNNFDEESKTWNLRPRKPMRKSLNVNGGTVKNNGLAIPEKSKAEPPLKNPNSRSGENKGNSCSGGEKKEKRKLSISVALSKEEIEEDIFALTGSKPARRPKKRAKNVQRQVDVR